MTSLMLVAASGLAREVIALERSLERYDDVVVVDDDQRRWGTSLDGCTVVGGLLAARSFHGDLVVCAGSGATRRRLVQRLSAMGIGPERFGRVLDPSVTIPPGCRVGQGSVLLAGVVLTAGVEVHRHVVVMPNATLTHDCDVRDFATVCAGVSLGGGVLVDEAAYLGMNASVRQGVHVGRGATLGMGAALLRDLPPGQTWAGVPAGSLAHVRPHQETTP